MDELAAVVAVVYDLLTSKVSMTLRRSTRKTTSIGLAVACCLLTAATTLAQQVPPLRPVGRLGGPTRFTAQMRDIPALARSMSRPGIQRDLATVLERAGMPSLTTQVQGILAKGQVTEATLAPGTVIEWMALRRRGPNVVRNLRWDRKTPLDGFEFTIDDMKETYTFFVPKICGNVSLVRREPSREAARLAEIARADAARAEAARAEAARAETARAEAARAEAARVEAARVEAARAEAARAEAARLEAERAEAARAEAARAEAARQAEAARLAEERDLRVRPFIAALAGKQQRQYDGTDPVNRGRIDPLTNTVPAFGDPLAGGKGGVALKMTEHWTFAPSVGAAVNLEESELTSVFADAEIAYMFRRGAYLGTGLTLWDFVHRKIFTPGWLGTAGVPVWQSDARKHQLLLVGEWRQLFDRMSDPDVNYQVWAGLKYLMK